MNSEKKKICVAGVLTLDLTALIPDNGSGRGSEMFRPGCSISLEGYEMHPGGAVTNVGRALRLFGNDVIMAARVGSDEIGQMILLIFEKEDPAAMRDIAVVDGEGTSLTLVLPIPGEDRIFMHTHGANDTFCYDDLNYENIAKTQLFHFGYPPTMRNMFINNGEELKKIYQKVRAAGTATSLDMTAIDPESEAGAVDWTAYLENVLPYVDFFVPSVEELCFMIDRPRFDEWVRRAKGGDVTQILDVEKDIRPLADRAMAMGTRILLLKCGSPGIYYCTAPREAIEEIGEKAGIDAAAWADKSGFEAGYVPERLCSATGAGDVAIAAFLTAALNGQTIEYCVRMATAAGACCVEGYDSVGSLQTFPEMERRIAAGWRKANGNEA